MLKGNADGMELAGRMGASQLRNLLYAYKERMDKNRFIQNLLLDNLLLVDIYNQAKKMKIPAEIKRVVFVIEPDVYKRQIWMRVSKLRRCIIVIMVKQ